MAMIMIAPYIGFGHTHSTLLFAPVSFKCSCICANHPGCPNAQLVHSFSKPSQTDLSGTRYRQIAEIGALYSTRSGKLWRVRLNI